MRSPLATMSKVGRKQNSVTAAKDDSNKGERGERSYKDAIHKNKWATFEHPIKRDLAAKEVIGDKDALRRSLAITSAASEVLTEDGKNCNTCSREITFGDDIKDSEEEV
ncbi:hypothetical protein HAX54_031202 [Datura stramonium]|uniref:Uncharacterized protein n=1 Tax=Datura stramonium TaxID=4076 RepID=A0ABS8VBZ0_DATST|nr:hypothetical protein [Datura stramonium]